MKKHIRYEDGPSDVDLDSAQAIKDFLPPPDQLVLKLPAASGRGILTERNSANLYAFANPTASGGEYAHYSSSRKEPSESTVFGGSCHVAKSTKCSRIAHWHYVQIEQICAAIIRA